jgi:ubiquinone/menaquinone biosynthesis C-methylase UbiE
MRADRQPSRCALANNGLFTLSFRQATEEAMAGTLEDSVTRHYGVSDLTERILKALAAAGIDADRIAPEQLAPVDEFHIGGRAATIHAVARMGLGANDHVLDVGCGIGGATRYIASTIGCRVTGLDLTPGYVAAAEELARRTGLAGRVAYRVASALAMPFETGAFDAALTLHVAMNIRDRAGLYREVARVLKPRAAFCIYDVMNGGKDGLKYPVPWAETPETSHLTTPQEMQVLLQSAGFEVNEIEDRTAFALDFFRQSLTAPAAGAPPLGLHIMMGANAREKFQNMLANIESGAIAPTLMIAKRAQ